MHHLTPAATALYDYAAGRWVSSPPIPTIGGLQYDSADGPGLDAAGRQRAVRREPVRVQRTDRVLSLRRGHQHDQPGARTSRTRPTTPRTTRGCSTCRTGRCCSTTAATSWRSTPPVATPNPSWAPSISSISSTNLKPGQTASLSGSQLSGLDQGAAYGDDVQDATNFPVVRITNSASGAVTYARTSNWSSVSVAPGATLLDATSPSARRRRPGRARSPSSPTGSRRRRSRSRSASAGPRAAAFGSRRGLAGLTRGWGRTPSAASRPSPPESSGARRRASR